MSVKINISLNEGLYLKEPQDSKLGRNIIEHSILMIEEFGFEAFTFKKLAINIKSTEASIYRYFVNKHRLLLYLVNWYWEWVNYLISINTLNVDDPLIKMEKMVLSLISAPIENPSVDYVHEAKLHKIVIAEGMKAYHTKEVDSENTKGFFSGYKNLTTSMSNIFLEVNPDFKYPNALASSLFEMSNDHIFFATHLPALTNIKIEKNNLEELGTMLNHFVSKLLK